MKQKKIYGIKYACGCGMEGKCEQHKIKRTINVVYAPRISNRYNYEDSKKQYKKEFKHGEEGTHYACQEQIKKYGGKTKCCGCTKHKCQIKREEEICNKCGKFCSKIFKECPECAVTNLLAKEKMELGS